MKSVCVFCGSQSGNNPVYAQAAHDLGVELARRGIRLVYGGGNVGLMGVIADAVLQSGGEVTGVIPNALVNRELAHAGVRDMRIVDSMHTRKALMAELSDAFVALPGGLGTFEELCEILTWSQLRFHHKPVAVLNVNDYFRPLLGMLERAGTENFMSRENLSLLRVSCSIPQLLQILGQESDSAEEETQAIRELT